LTAKQIADELNLSPSTILGHIEKLLKCRIIKEVEVAKKIYKRERYYDIDIVTYLKDEEKEIEIKISKYADILSETAKAVLKKSIEELSDYASKLLMSRHGNPLERDDVRYFIWMKLMQRIGNYISKEGIFREPLETERKWYLYIGLKKKQDH